MAGCDCGISICMQVDIRHGAGIFVKSVEPDRIVEHLDIVLMLGFTALGIFMEYFELPISPFILTFILSNMIESNLRRAISYSDRGIITFLSRPMTSILLFVAVFSIVWPFLRDHFKKTNRPESGTV